MSNVLSLKMKFKLKDIVNKKHFNKHKSMTCVHEQKQSNIENNKTPT